MTTQMIDLFGGNYGVAGVDAYGRKVANAAGFAGQSAAQAGMRMNDLYFNQYQPYDQKLMQEVDSMGTESYRAQKRGQAMADVGMQIGSAQQAMNRNMARMGVDPSSGRLASAQGQLAMQGALGKAQAGMAADRTARDEYKQGLGAVNAMGVKVGELGAKQTMAAAEMGKLGLAASDLGANAADRNTNAQANMTSAGAAATNASANVMNAGTNATRAANDFTINTEQNRLAGVRDANNFTINTEQNRLTGVRDTNNHTVSMGNLDVNRTNAATQQTQVGNTHLINLGNLALNKEKLDTGNAFTQQGIDTAADQGSLGHVVTDALIGGFGKYVFTKDGMNMVSDGLSWLDKTIFGSSGSGAFDTSTSVII